MERKWGRKTCVKGISSLWSSVKCGMLGAVQFSRSVVSNSCEPMNHSSQASLSITISWSLGKPTSIELVMPSNHLILCCPLFLLPSIPPSIRVFSNESALCIRWPKYWSFSLNISLVLGYFGRKGVGGFCWNPNSVFKGLEREHVKGPSDQPGCDITVK